MSNFKLINPNPIDKQLLKTGLRKAKAEQVLSNRLNNITVVFENIYDPHNAMASLRSCEAFGIGNICFVFEKTPAFNPLKIGKKSSSSANKWLTYFMFESSADCLLHLKNNDFINVATVVTNDSIQLPEFKKQKGKKYAVWFGNEKEGLSEYAVKKSDIRLSIPMNGFVQSLNLSVSVGIILYSLRYCK
ncbi:MAG: tRNA (guanosine(18)-2'-O)-methyltransferase [Patescibacteria group bacterium]|nr:MAG: tRNA (guanosine(18)-2'-O)-methyltransferase [Patescibacteria group bacterium]